jgi:hypothetical protein
VHKSYSRIRNSLEEDDASHGPSKEVLKEHLKTLYAMMSMQFIGQAVDTGVKPEVQEDPQRNL